MMKPIEILHNVEGITTSLSKFDKSIFDKDCVIARYYVYGRHKDKSLPTILICQLNKEIVFINQTKQMIRILSYGDESYLGIYQAIMVRVKYYQPNYWNFYVDDAIKIIEKQFALVNL